jgi:hypothetical protein
MVHVCNPSYSGDRGKKRIEDLGQPRQKIARPYPKNKRTRVMAQRAKCLPSKREALSPILSTKNRIKFKK